MCVCVSACVCVCFVYMTFKNTAVYWAPESLGFMYVCVHIGVFFCFVTCAAVGRVCGCISECGGGNGFLQLFVCVLHILRCVRNIFMCAHKHTEVPPA